MKLHDTLTDLLADVRDMDRELRLINGENDESVVSFGDLWGRAIELLGSLQARGMKPGDELIIGRVGLGRTQLGRINKVISCVAVNRAPPLLVRAVPGLKENTDPAAIIVSVPA